MQRSFVHGGCALLCALFASCSSEPVVFLRVVPDDAGAPSSMPGDPVFFPHGAVQRTPPPLSGGTLLILRDDRTAIASDPDHDVIWIADITGQHPVRSVPLTRGDEPGRAAQDANGLVHVVARAGASLVTIDPTTASIVARRSVCVEPRGVAWDSDAGVLHVACTGGELVRLPSTGGPTRRLRLAPDLRDVVVNDGSVFVTRFRSASVLRVDGDLVTDLGPPPAAQSDSAERDPQVAWRTLAVGHRLMVLHQAATTVPLGTTPSPQAYYGPITSPTASIVPRLAWLMTSRDAATGRWEVAQSSFPTAGLTIDVAVAHDNANRVALVSPGWAFGQGPAQVTVYGSTEAPTQRLADLVHIDHYVSVPGQAVAAAFTRSGQLVVQTRGPGALVVDGSERSTISLYTDNVGETGHDIFHATTISGLACASCHPEGDDDGRTWELRTEGRRRTPSLRGGLLATAPFHWGGNLRTMEAFVAEVFGRRMGGGSLHGGEVNALGRWIDSLALHDRTPPDDREGVARGEALFRSSETRCTECHGGSLYTNNQTVDVGTGGWFQVPSLRGLGRRAPYMHDGCAVTLRQRFTDPVCGGGERHGRSAGLTASQLDDLVAFLEAL